jgi:hypothetical protein
VLDARSMSAAEVEHSLDALGPVLTADHLSMATFARMR